MTSAQNRPQQLSGNNWIMLFLVGILFLASCTALQPIVPDGKSKEETDLPEIEGEHTTTDTNKKPKEPNTNTKPPKDDTSNNTKDPEPKDENTTADNISRPKNPRVIDWKTDVEPDEPDEQQDI